MSLTAHLARRSKRKPSGTDSQLASHPYLTDGTGLYRFLGWAIEGTFATFEDCRPLELILFPSHELSRARLRCVTPAKIS